MCLCSRLMQEMCLFFHDCIFIRLVISLLENHNFYKIKSRLNIESEWIDKTSAIGQSAHRWRTWWCRWSPCCSPGWCRGTAPPAPARWTARSAPRRRTARPRWSPTPRTRRHTPFLKQQHSITNKHTHQTLLKNITVKESRTPKFRFMSLWR